jgi:hypothetical protein
MVVAHIITSAGRRNVFGFSRARLAKTKRTVDPPRAEATPMNVVAGLPSRLLKNVPSMD